ncbi:hypothetical protein Tco_1341041, partial [Tanacetum coccineum]
IERQQRRFPVLAQKLILSYETATSFTLANELNHGNFKINGVFKPKTLALMPPTTDSAATSSTSQDTEDAIAITTAKNKVDVSTPPTENQL